MNESKMSYKVLFKDFVFVRLLVANVISRFGDAIDSVAYGYMVYQLTGSVVLLATLFAVNGIPSILGNLISGVVVRYLNKKTVVWICDLGRGSIVALTGIFYFFGILEVWHLFLFTFINSSFEAFRSPASVSFFVAEIEEEKFEYATSLQSSITFFSELVGYAVSGIVIGLLTVSGAILLDGITFFLSGIAILSIKNKKEILPEEKLTFKTYLNDLKEGIQYLQNNRLVLTISLFAGGFMFFVVPFNSLQPAYVKEVLNRGPEALAIMGVAFLSAMMISSLFVPALKKIAQPKHLLVASGVQMALSYGGLALLDYLNGGILSLLLFILLCITMGASIPLFNLITQVAIMKSVDREYLPRVISLLNILALSANPIGGFLVGALLTILHLTTIFYVFSVALLVLFLSQLLNKNLDTLA